MLPFCNGRTATIDPALPKLVKSHRREGPDEYGAADPENRREDQRRQNAIPAVRLKDGAFGICRVVVDVHFCAGGVFCNHGFRVPREPVQWRPSQAYCRRRKVALTDTVGVPDIGAVFRDLPRRAAATADTMQRR